MTPLWESRSASQVLIEVAAKVPPAAAALAYDDFYSFVQSRVGRLFPDLSSDGLETAERAAQQRGVHSTEIPPEQVRLRVPEPGLLRPTSVTGSQGVGLDLVVFPTALCHDGRGSSLPWLKEVPDALTDVSWTAWAEFAPVTAKRLGIVDGDILSLTTAVGTVELPACIFEGLREDAVGVPLGPEPLALLNSTVDTHSGSLAWQSSRARVTLTGKRIDLPRLTATPYEEGRTIVRTVSAAAPAVPTLPAAGKMYPLPSFPKHRWAMAIDMDRCTGCQACVVACYAENNVPVVGPEAMTRGRNMAWLRVEHFVSVEANQPRVDLLLMLCQQCGNAPCETVCPVYATYTNPEGLNAQVYNRCVGTRYCSNNCPYKVRVFNWREPEFPKPLNMQLNPDVTVRSKGVMEKCTFCVQRIRAGEIAAEAGHRNVRDGEIVPACAQTCPAQAIVFGDANDPTSRVAALQRDPRGYHVLGELNTLPAITYLARVREGT
jgi:Fe-S-cluster-containing dehydrogenase component